MNAKRTSGRASLSLAEVRGNASPARRRESPAARAAVHRRVAPVIVAGVMAGVISAAELCPLAMARAEDVSRSAARAEPTVDELCRAAVALALAEPERARSFILRARAAGWLPELRFRVFRRFARTEGLTLDDTTTSTPVDVSGVDDVRYEWRATWDLSRIVFNPDELQAHAEALRMADARHDIQSLVIRLYFERRRLLASSPRTGAAGGADSASDHAEQAGSAAPEAKDERRRLRVLELEAQLEALSGVSFPPDGVATSVSPGGAP